MIQMYAFCMPLPINRYCVITETKTIWFDRQNIGSWLHQSPEWWRGWKILKGKWETFDGRVAPAAGQRWWSSGYKHSHRGLVRSLSVHLSYAMFYSGYGWTVSLQRVRCHGPLPPFLRLCRKWKRIVKYSEINYVSVHTNWNGMYLISILYVGFEAELISKYVCDSNSFSEH